MKLIHCSFDLVDEFIPRVPDSRVTWKGKEYEDAETPRICVAPTVLDCLRGMPKAGEIIRWMKAVGMDVVIHAYYLTADKVKICTTDDVIDADRTHEMWVLEKPSNVVRRDYLIAGCYMIDQTDQFGKPCIWIAGCNIVRVPNKDNLQDFIEGIGLEYGEFMRKFSFLTFRGLAMNVGFTEELKRMRRKNMKDKAYERLKRRVALHREREETE